MIKLRPRDKRIIEDRVARFELENETPLNSDERPRTRADCANVPRPCPFVGCRHNNYLEVLDGGMIKLNHALDPWDVPPEKSCSLDVAETDGGVDIRSTADAIGCSSTRIDQVMRGVELKLRSAHPESRRLREYKGP